MTELIGHIHRDGRASRSRSPATSAPRSRRCVGERRPRRHGRLRGSSFQLEDSEAFAPECAVFLNLAPDHLDRHGTIEDYLEAKLRIFANQGNDDVAVYNADEPRSRTRPRRLRAAGRLLPGRGGDPDCELACDDGAIFAATSRCRGLRAGAARRPQRRQRDGRRGRGARDAASTGDAVARGPAELRGRRRTGSSGWREIDGVLYVNDSKATNVAAALAAIDSFDGGVHVILGGSLKGERFEALARAGRRALRRRAT